jgi:hypothetical protein
MKIMIYAQELLSVVLTPFVLWFSLPDCAPAIVDFFREFTIHVDSLGYVCSFAVFDFQRHGNVKVSLDLVLLPFSSICVVLFPLLPPFSSIVTPRSMILVGSLGCAWSPVDGLDGNRSIDGRDGPRNIIGARKTFFAELFLSCLVWRADDGK